MWTLFITMLVWQQGNGMTTITKQEVTNIVSAEECENAARTWRLQGVENRNVQVMTVCIKRNS